MPIEKLCGPPKKQKRLHCNASKWWVTEQKQSFCCRKTHNGCGRAKKSSVPEKPSVNEIQVTRAGHEGALNVFKLNFS